MKPLIIAALLLSAGCAPGPRPRVVPVPDEAHGMPEPERSVALHVLRSHYRNLLDTLGSARIPGIDLKDHSRPAVCDLSVSRMGSGDFPPGVFIDGAPHRRAHPVIFTRFQEEVTGKLSGCTTWMAPSPQAWRDLQNVWLRLVELNSATTYCREDKDCYATEIDVTGREAPVIELCSDSTDAVFTIATRKFIPGLLTQLSGLMTEQRAADPRLVQLAPWQTPAWPWREQSRPAVCVEHACRLKAP